jgi:hypothetical protein
VSSHRKIWGNGGLISLFRVAVLVLCAAFHPSPLHARELNPGEAALIREVADYTRNALYAARLAIRVHVTREQLAIFDQVYVEIDENDWSLYSTRAEGHNNKPVIIIPIGHVVATYYLDVAMAEAIQSKQFRDLDRYRTALIKGLDVDPVSKQVRNPITLGLCEFRGTKKEVCARNFYDPQLSTILWQLRYLTVSFLLAHEAGHHLLGHLTDRFVVPNVREREADQFALEIMNKMNWHPLFGVNNLLLFAELDRFRISKGASLAEPLSPACRLVNLLLMIRPFLREAAMADYFASTDLPPLDVFDKQLSAAQTREGAQCS